MLFVPEIIGTFLFCISDASRKKWSNCGNTVGKITYEMNVGIFAGEVFFFFFF
jgi:hypothetical protein